MAAKVAPATAGGTKPTSSPKQKGECPAAKNPLDRSTAIGDTDVTRASFSNAVA
jgi:hypothetical protein